MLTRIGLSLLIIAVSGAGIGTASDGLDVVVSVVPQRWLVEKIGGDRMTVEVLVEPGESPATYMPTDAQVTGLMRADLFLRIGAPFERGLWFDAVIQLGRIRMVDQRRDVDLRGDDPHIWLSPGRLAVQARTVADALSQVDPTHRALYEGNLESLLAELTELDRVLRLRLRPFTGREFFVFHPSWGYFADDYDLVQVAVEVGGREPSDSELTELQRRAREAKVKTVFVQPQIHGRGAQAFAAGIGAKVETLDPLAENVAANLEATARKLQQAFEEASGNGQ